ncbi:sulfotransferase family protein [Bauldia sp.]|uniref:sulfotransferase family protein n=1 Tax=Bauldia sp. TaxID=2575872 RepID=UPI003BA85866
MFSVTRVVGAWSKRRHRRLGFVGVGAQKCGTTTLHDLLALHPEIEVPRRKELHYFRRDARFDADYRPRSGSYSGLHRHFYFDRAVAGEITPLYLYWRPSLERIHAYNPDIKIIVLLRNPVKRAYSQWGHYVRKSTWRKHRHKTIKPFRNWVKREARDTARDPNYQRVRRSLIGRSLYAGQIKRVISLFTPEQVMFVKSETFFADQAGVTDDVCRFLGVAPLSSVAELTPVHENVGTIAPISPADWDIAYKHLADDIARVEDALGWDCADWRLPPHAAPVAEDRVPEPVPTS